MEDIRDLRDDDADALIELIASCWAPYPGIVLDVDGELPHLRAPASAYARLGGRAWAVDGDGGLAGSVAVVPGPEPGTAELRMLYVRADRRRAGLGRRLLATAERAAADELGAARMVLWSDTRFTDAHRFYERNGYTRGPATRELHDLSATVELFFDRSLP